MDKDDVTILLVDDDDFDVHVVRRALKRHRMTNPVVVARDGVEALEVLRETDKSFLPKPVLVLLDLNMPRMTGWEFLADLRSDPKLQHTVVFVLTSSDHPTDRRTAHELNVAGYLLKQEAGRDFQRHLSLLEYFLATMKFPKAESQDQMPSKMQPLVPSQ